MQMTLSTLLVIGCGGALGAISRYAISVWAAQRFDSDFPIGTFAANAVGAFLIGLLFVMINERGIVSENWRPLLVVGLLGALTTFSTFSLEAVSLLQQGEWLTAMVYVIGSVILCLSLTWAGIELARCY